MSKKRAPRPNRGEYPKIKGQFVGLPIDVVRIGLELSPAARRILDVLILENCRHRGLENGNLICTYTDLERRAHVSRGHLREALRELEAEGLIRIRRGRPAYGDLRIPSIYTLTFLPTIADGRWVDPTDDWKQKAGLKRSTGAGLKRSTGRPQKPDSKGELRKGESRTQKENSYLDIGVDGVGAGGTEGLASSAQQPSPSTHEGTPTGDAPPQGGEAAEPSPLHHVEAEAEVDWPEFPTTGSVH